MSRLGWGSGTCISLRLPKHTATLLGLSGSRALGLFAFTVLARVALPIELAETRSLLLQGSPAAD